MFQDFFFLETSYGCFRFFFLKHHTDVSSFFLFFFASTPLQNSFAAEVDAMVKGKNMRTGVSPDGIPIFSLPECINLMNEKDINDPYGTNVAGKLVNDDSDDNALLKSFGFYKICNGRGRGTHALSFKGLKGLMCTNALRGAAHARKYIHYAADVTTRLEAADPSPNIYNAMARDAVAQERAAGGPSIAAPPEQVLERACLLLLHLR
jgi:hypothetical protein